MTKAKAKSEEAVGKAAKASPSTAKKPRNLAEARKKITNMVRADSTSMVKAVAVGALSGQLASMKYLFEVSGLYPATAGSEAEPEGDSLARTLLHHMGLPVTSKADETKAKPTRKASESRKKELVEKKSDCPPTQKENVEGKGSESEEQESKPDKGEALS